MSGVKSVIFLAACACVAAAVDGHPPACDQLRPGYTECSHKGNVGFVQYKFLTNARNSWEFDQSATCSLCPSSCYNKDFEDGDVISDCAEVLKSFGVKILRYVWVTESENSLTYTVKMSHAASSQRELYLPVPPEKTCNFVIRYHRYEARLCRSNRRRRDTVQSMCQTGVSNSKYGCKPPTALRRRRRALGKTTNCPDGYVIAATGFCQKTGSVSRLTRGVVSSDRCGPGYIIRDGDCVPVIRMKRNNAQSTLCSSGHVSVGGICLERKKVKRSTAILNFDGVHPHRRVDHEGGALRRRRSLSYITECPEGYKSVSGYCVPKWQSYRVARAVVNAEKCPVGQYYDPVLGCTARQGVPRPARGVGVSSKCLDDDYSSEDCIYEIKI